MWTGDRPQASPSRLSRSFGNERPVGEVAGVHDAEDARVVPAFKLFGFTLILWNVPIDERLEQAPHALDAVGVNVADNPLLAEWLTAPIPK